MTDVMPRPLAVPAGFDWLQRNKRRQYLRAKLAPGADGQMTVALHPQQSSAMLTAACWADGLAVIECEQQVRKHDNVMFLSFADLMQ